MEDRSCTGFAFKSSIEDTVIDDSGDVHYCFAVYASLEEAQAMAEEGDEIVGVWVRIEECPSILALAKHNQEVVGAVETVAQRLNEKEPRRGARGFENDFDSLRRGLWA